MKSVLICHHDTLLDREGLAGWLASFSDLAGIVVIREEGQRLKRRIKREVERSGALRFLDVLAFRLYYKLLLAPQDKRVEAQLLEDLALRYGKASVDTPIFETHSPNSKEARAFVRDCAPDFMIARCKTILRRRMFSIPTVGTFVIHPGICPEYRNAHGCFWALAQGDTQRCGATLLQIDKGVDTGPVYGYYRYDFDEASETHIEIQNRSVVENLDDIAAKLREVAANEAERIDTTGRESDTWGQPWMTEYVRWKVRAHLHQLRDRVGI
ncbi:MAG: formyl transferase [Deltaproteobacteria bacterium]|nr:formyl transferase [Deltaproteobacteria bacterium]